MSHYVWAVQLWLTSQVSWGVGGERTQPLGAVGAIPVYVSKQARQQVNLSGRRSGTRWVDSWMPGRAAQGLVGAADTKQADLGKKPG